MALRERETNQRYFYVYEPAKVTPALLMEARTDFKSNGD